MVLVSLKRYEELIEKLDFEGLKTLSEIESEDFKKHLENIKQSIVTLNTTLEGLGGGTVRGAVLGGLASALTYYGAFGAVGLLGTASTGAAISTLSGVAATTATLAWFGGGSLVAGGLGMVAGSLVFGSIVVAPAVAIFGALAADSAKDEKNKAARYFNDVCKLCEALQLEGSLWKLLRIVLPKNYTLSKDTTKS